MASLLKDASSEFGLYHEAVPVSTGRLVDGRHARCADHSLDFIRDGRSLFEVGEGDYGAKTHGAVGLAKRGQ